MTRLQMPLGQTKLHCSDTKTKTNGNIFALSACMTSICKNVGASEGGIATSDFANSKCVMSIDPVTSYEAEMADGICGTAMASLGNWQGA